MPERPPFVEQRPLCYHVAVHIAIGPDVTARAPQLCLGWLVMRGLAVRAHDDGLWAAVERAGADFAARYGINQLASDPHAQAVRRLFKSVGVDPARYRPSSEALARRVVQGKGLYAVNTAVDVNNWCSLEERLPFGIYDAARIDGPVLLRLGRESEAYDGIGKALISVEGKLTLADDRGAFGSPVADSARTLVGVQTRDIILVVFGAGMPASDMHLVLQRAADRLAQFNGGTLAHTQVLEPAARTELAHD